MAANEWEGKESNFYGTEMEWSHYDAKTNKRLIQAAGFDITFDEVDTSGGEEHLIILAQKRLHQLNEKNYCY